MYGSFLVQAPRNYGGVRGVQGCEVRGAGCKVRGAGG